MKAPAKLGLPGARTRFDEFQAIHQLQAYATHHVVCLEPRPSKLVTISRSQLTFPLQGAFLPFHRLLMLAHETALRDECNYQP